MSMTTNYAIKNNAGHYYAGVTKHGTSIWGKPTKALLFHNKDVAEVLANMVGGYVELFTFPL